MLFVLKGRSVLRVALVFCAAALAWAQSEALVRKSQEAKQLMAEGRFADAVPLCQELVRAIPDNIGLRLNLGLAYHMSGRQQEAIPEFERVLKADPDNQPALMSLGPAFLELNQPAKAIAPLQKVVAAQPDNANMRGMLANVLLSLDRAAEAAPHFRKLSALTPEDPKSWFGLGRTYEALAQQAFAELDKTAQGSAEWLALIADSRIERRQFRSAFYFYKQALAKDPRFPGLHSGIAEVYRRTEHPDWAAAEQAKEVKPNCAVLKPACDFAAGRYAEAAKSASPYWRARAYNELAFQAFSKLGSLPPSVEMHALKAEIASNHGDYMEAVNEWRAADKLAPGNPRIARSIAVALHEAADYRGAVPMLEQLVANEPRAAELQFLLGDSLLRLEQLENAVPHLEAAAHLRPDLLPARASLGLTYIRLGKAAEAVPHLEAALPIDDDGSLHYQLARAYQRSGRAEEAKLRMQEYQQIQRRSEQEKQKLEQEAAIVAP